VKKLIWLTIAILVLLTIKAQAKEVVDFYENMFAFNYNTWYNILEDRGNEERYEVFTITAYDLGYESCGKTQKHKQYGITATGFNLKGMYWEDNKYIAVDPDVIPLGSKVRIVFNDPEHNKYSGEYEAVDTGGAIKGNKIDLFIGDFKQKESSKEAIDFGITKALVKILD